MIYEVPAAGLEIRQGDIFKWIPRCELGLRPLHVVSQEADGQTVERDWIPLVSEQGTTWPLPVIAAVRPVFAIVITQDCDAVRSPDIALCEISPFKDVYSVIKSLPDRPEQNWKPKKWSDVITQHSRANQKWYYLPSSEDIGFSTRMAVDFRTIIRVDREDLESFRSDLRIARLNEVALAHFRERIAEFFRRYAYDEWYPLDKEEFAAYQEACPEPVLPFPWQTTEVTNETEGRVEAGAETTSSSDSAHREPTAIQEKNTLPQTVTKGILSLGRRIRQFFSKSE